MIYAHQHKSFFCIDCVFAPLRETKLTVIGVFVGMCACAALVFAWRRVSGALVSPLSSGLLIPSGLLAGVLVLGIRTLWRRSAVAIATPRGDLVLDTLLCASLLIFAAALSLPGTNTWGIAFFWLIIAGEEFFAWRPRARQWIDLLRSKKRTVRQVRVDPAQSVVPHVEPAETPPAAISQVFISSDQPAKEVTQQLTRSTTADGSDVLAGWLRLDFAPHQRMGNLHVAFCPPFAGTPELTVTQLDGPEARIKIAQLLPYGVRLDLKLVSFSEEPCGVLVQFCARSAGTNHNS